MSVQEINLTGTITIAKEVPKLQKKTVSASGNEKIVVTADDGYDALESVTVNEIYPLTIRDGVVRYVTIPAMDLVAPADATSIADDAFELNKVIKSFSGENILSVGIDAFQGSTIQSVNLPNATTIGMFAFGGCQSLTALELPSATSIGNSAFLGSRVASVKLPVIQSLDGGSLNGDYLSDAYLGYDGVVSFDGSPFAGDGENTITVHVPADQLANYQADTSWTALIASLAEDGVTLTIVGDYVV